MARRWLGVFLLLCINVHFSKQQNLRCAALLRVFPTCPCRPATEEKGSVYAIVDCSGQGLTSVPTIAEPYDKVIYKLVLKNNSITTLFDNSFQGLQVEYLDLTGNSLDSVENNTFLSMKDSLKTLEIDGDSNSFPPTGALNELNVIESLTMRHYDVSIIEQTHNLFLKFSHLTSLTLDYWATTYHIEARAFLGLGNLRSLSLLHMNLANMPVDALNEDPFDNLETLKITDSLSPNGLQTVSPGVFQKLSKLKILDLSNNQINELEINCFKDVGDTLEHINLKQNVLNNDVGKLIGFSGLAALVHLDMSHNTFTKIPSMPKLGATKPFKLLLGNNEINEVQNYGFTGYAQFIQYLDLTENYIRSMASQSFDGVNQLDTLYVKNQRGHNSDPVVLPITLKQSASTLKTLDVSGQKVDPSSLWEVVKDLTSLQTLNLNSVELQSIPDMTFQKLASLEKLHMSYNSLSTLTQKSLAGLRQLKRLDLQGTSLQTIPSCLFFEFESSQITLNLFNNAITCDCRIRQLLEDVKSGRIVFDPTPPTCNGESQPLDASKILENLRCDPQATEQPCIDYYSTSPPPVTDQPVTDPDPPTLRLKVLEVKLNSLKASWTISHTINFRKFHFQVTSANSVIEFNRDNLPATQNVMEATNLPADSHVTVCVTAFFTSNTSPLTKCEVNKTLGLDLDNGGGASEKTGGDSDNADTAIIVGCVVAGVAFIGVVVAILILLLFRKKTKKVPDNYAAPTQPRNFAKAELPAMTDDSRTFIKKPNKNGKTPQRENMQVVAISDGQTSPGYRVGRVNMVFQAEDGYEPMANYKKGKGGSSSGSMYENDRGSLPPTPGRDSRPPSYPGTSYYNQAFDDKYDKIDSNSNEVEI